MDLTSSAAEVAESAKDTKSLDNSDFSKTDFDKPFEKSELEGMNNCFPPIEKPDFDEPIEKGNDIGDKNIPIDSPFDNPFDDGDVIIWHSDGSIEKHNPEESRFPTFRDPMPQNFDNNNFDVDTSRIDDNGKEYKDENGELLPNSEYTVNGTTYHTDELGRIIDWKGELKDTPENERDRESQTESGGKDRKEGDDGGHLQGRQNGGAPGNENLVPMRDTVNRGDYLKTENEENQMLKDGKTVTESGDVTYNGDSARPSKIHKEYTDGEKTVKADFDNEAGSKELLDKLNGDISDEDLQSLKDEISDMEADGNEVSVTSVKKDYDSEGNLKTTTVGVRNETTGEKYYRTFTNN